MGVADTAFPHRAAGYNLLVLSEWTDPARTVAAGVRDLAFVGMGFAALRLDAAPQRTGSARRSG